MRRTLVIKRLSKLSKSMHDERIRLQIISNIEIRHNDTPKRFTDQKTITYSQSINTESLERCMGYTKLTIQRPKRRQ